MDVSRIIPDFCTCPDHDSAKYQSYQLAILMLPFLHKGLSKEYELDETEWFEQRI